ncbi:FUSC family protein [Mycobacterium sp. BMJ-28]
MSKARGGALGLTLYEFGAVARSLLGVLAVATAALYLDSSGAAIAAGGAAAMAGATALQDSPRSRIALVTAVSLEMALAVAVGGFTAEWTPVFLAVVAAWCFLAGMQWALSANAGMVAAGAAVLLVTASPIAGSTGAVLTSSALALLGGLAQAVLIAVWPQRRWRAQREALTRAYRSLGADARRLATEPDAQVDRQPLIRLREAFTLTESQARRRPPAYRGWYGLPERIAVTLSALGRDGTRNEAAADALRAAADLLEIIARRTPRRAIAPALARMDTTADALDGTTATVAQRLSRQLAEAVELRFGQFEPEQVAQLRRPGLPHSWAAATGLVRAQLRWSSPIFRHAVRLAVACTAGVAIAHAAGAEHGYWITVTVLMVLRPETAHTYTRCIGRITGNAVGVVGASTFTALLHPGGPAAAALAVIFLGIAYSATEFGYVAVSAALAAAIIFLLDVSGHVDAGTVEQRWLATVVGGALAVIVHVGLPDNALVRLRQRAGELLKTEVDYAATVIRAFVHEVDHPAETLSAAWQRAASARTAFEAAAGATKTEEPAIRRWLGPYRASLNAVTTSCATLEATLPAHPSPTLDREFISAIDGYVKALMGNPATPAAPWRVDAEQLTAAAVAVRDAAALLRREHGPARVLVAELATITRMVVDIAAENPAVSPWPTSAG